MFNRHRCALAPKAQKFLEFGFVKFYRKFTLYFGIGGGVAPKAQKFFEFVIGSRKIPLKIHISLQLGLGGAAGYCLKLNEYYDLRHRRRNVGIRGRKMPLKFHIFLRLGAVGA